MPTRYRPVQLGPTATEVERDPEGRYLLRATEPLGSYPTRLTERLRHWAETTPQRTFLAKRDAQRAWQNVRYDEAMERVEVLSAALLARGLSVERPLVILSENDLEHALLSLAAQHVGIPFAPVSPAYSLMSRDYAQLIGVLTQLTPGLVFAADGVRYGRAIEAAVGKDVEVVLTSGGDALERPTSSFAELVLAGQSQRARVAPAHANVGPDTIAKLLMTSGSTGSPKAVIQTMRMLTSNLQMIAQCLPFLNDEPPVVVDWLPWHHVFGGNHNLGIVLYHGGTFYIDDGRPAPGLFEETLRNLREVAPTVYFNVPRGYDELVRALARDEALAQVFFRRLKLLFYAGASLSQRTWDALEQLAEKTCGERIVMITGLGMTETAPWALSAHWAGSAAGVMGVPASGLELRLTQHGDKLEACYRGPSVTPGFFRNETLTERAFDDDGFYRSGDALRFVDPERPERGLRFDGRLAEDFKLDTGTWVSVGPLRARVLLEGAPYVQDIVPTAPDRGELGMLIVPHGESCRELCPSLTPDATLADVLARPELRRYFQDLLERLARAATGSATRITRALLLTEPLSLDRGEVTDKGTLVQATVRRTRAEAVDRLYSDHPEVLVLPAR